LFNVSMHSFGPLATKPPVFIGTNRREIVNRGNDPRRRNPAPGKLLYHAIGKERAQTASAHIAFNRGRKEFRGRQITMAPDAVPQGFDNRSGRGHDARKSDNTGDDAIAQKKLFVERPGVLGCGDEPAHNIVVGDHKGERLWRAHNPSVESFQERTTELHEKTLVYELGV
jgi:hypothetical protein